MGRLITEGREFREVSTQLSASTKALEQAGFVLLAAGLDLVGQGPVDEHLGIAPTSRTTLRPTVMTAADIEPVNGWIRECAVAWIEYQSASETEALEKALHAEWMPTLSRR